MNVKKFKISHSEELAINLPKFHLNEDEDYSEGLLSEKSNKRINKENYVLRRKEIEAKEFEDRNSMNYIHGFAKKPEMIFKISSGEEQKNEELNNEIVPPYFKWISEFSDINSFKNDIKVKRKDSNGYNINIDLLKRDMDEYNAVDSSHINDNSNNFKNSNNISANQEIQSDIVSDYLRYSSNYHMNESPRYQNLISHPKVLSSNQPNISNKSSNISSYNSLINNNINNDTSFRRLSLPVGKSLNHGYSWVQSEEFEKVYNNQLHPGEQSESVEDWNLMNKRFDLGYQNPSSSFRFASNDFLPEKRGGRNADNSYSQPNINSYSIQSMPSYPYPSSQQVNLNSQTKLMFNKNQWEDENDLKPINSPFI